MSSNEEYRFYSQHRGKRGWMFSNYSAHEVIALGELWPTSEHLYQAMKYIKDDPEYAEKIRLASTPHEAKKLGQSRNHPIREDWEKVKNKIMYFVVLAKVTQNSDVEEELRNTGDRIIIEDSPYDYYWGCGKNNTGKNQLGKTLMKVRELVQIVR